MCVLCIHDSASDKTFSELDTKKLYTPCMYQYYALHECARVKRVEKKRGHLQRLAYVCNLKNYIHKLTMREVRST